MNLDLFMNYSISFSLLKKHTINIISMIFNVEIGNEAPYACTVIINQRLDHCIYRVDQSFDNCICRKRIDDTRLSIIDTCLSCSTVTSILSYNTCFHMKSSAYNTCNNKNRISLMHIVYNIRSAM